jgi:hypothetical protein
LDEKEMTPHLSNEVVERFHTQALAGGDKAVIYDHILGCESCRLRIVNPRAQSIAVAAMTAHLLPQDAEEPYHLDYETIEAFVDDKLDPIDRSAAKLHLEDCAECSAEIEDLRESLATMKAASRQQLASWTKVETPPRTAIKFTVPVRIAAMVAIAALGALMVFVIWRWKSSGPTQVPGTDRTAETKPTPNSSPITPSLGPSPAIVTPPKLVENPPTKGLNEMPAPTVAALKDGAHEISIDQAGNVIGAPALSTDSQRTLKAALTGESLVRPTVLDDVATAEESVRAPTGNEERIRILSPTRTVILQDKPTLRWTPSTTADAYRIEIADESFRRVDHNDELLASTQSWTPTVRLARGQIYTWTIRAVSKGGEPSQLTSQGKFKILSEDKVREWNRLRSANSHLALGLFYAREGMIADAEREFGILLKANPDSAVAKKLLREVQGWRKR